jgi:TPR repeat protein
MSAGVWTLTLLNAEEEAVSYFKKAIEQGNPDGHGGLALVMAKYDYKVALNIFEKGVNLGSAYCTAFMGMFYSNGVYVKKDITKAKKYLKIAIESTCYEAQRMASNEMKKIEEAEKANKASKKKSSSKKAKQK